VKLTSPGRVLRQSRRLLPHANSKSNAAVDKKRFIASHRRSTIELAGVFIFLSAVALAGAALHTSTASTGPVNSASAQLQLNHTAATAASPSPSSPPTSDNSEASTTTTTANSSNTSDGTASTQVTVNGQPIAVPANGSTQQTVTGPDGQKTTISTSNSQSTDGSANNHSFTHTNVHISSNSSSSDTQEGQ
jgi:hypothetical protein